MPMPWAPGGLLRIIVVLVMLPVHLMGNVQNGMEDLGVMERVTKKRRGSASNSMVRMLCEERHQSQPPASRSASTMAQSR